MILGELDVYDVLEESWIVLSWTPSSLHHFQDLVVPFFVSFPALPPIFGALFLTSMSLFKVILALSDILQHSLVPSSPFPGPSSFVLYPIDPSYFVLPQPIV